jgi:hypothetical protein
VLNFARTNQKTFQIWWLYIIPIVISKYR